MYIETDRLIIRDFELIDWKAVFQYTGDELYPRRGFHGKDAQNIVKKHG